MSNFVLAAGVFLLSLGVAAATIPFIVRHATHYKLLDYPDGDRRMHARPVPRLGGVAVFAGLLAALAAMQFATWAGIAALPPLTPLLPALIAGCCILFFIGLFDDLRGVPPFIKLAGQTLAALLVVSTGFGVDLVSMGPTNNVSLGALGSVLTVVWLVGISNSYNLVDGLDGLAGTVGVIALAAIALSATALGTHNVTLHAAALAGALFGFLLFNFSPARIFLGDSGSLVVGFLLAVLSIRGATGPDGVLHPMVPVFALAYLLLDTGLAIARRWLRGEPLSRADGRHVHHQLRALGMSNGGAVGLIGACALSIGVLGLAATFMPPQATVAMASLAIISVLLMSFNAVRWLEYHELVEAGASVASAARKARSVIRDRIHARDLANAICRVDSMEELQQILEAGAPVFRFAHMQLGTSVRELPEHVQLGVRSALLWKLEFPILLADQEWTAGRLPKPLILTIWSQIKAARPVGAERVAQILGPAIATRLRTMPSDQWHPVVVRSSDMASDVASDAGAIASLKVEPMLQAQGRGHGVPAHPPS